MRTFATALQDLNMLLRTHSFPAFELNADDDFVSGTPNAPGAHLELCYRDEVFLRQLFREEDFFVEMRVRYPLPRFAIYGANQTPITAETPVSEAIYSGWEPSVRTYAARLLPEAERLTGYASQLDDESIRCFARTDDLLSLGLIFACNNDAQRQQLAQELQRLSIRFWSHQSVSNDGYPRMYRILIWDPAVALTDDRIGELRNFLQRLSVVFSQAKALAAVGAFRVSGEMTPALALNLGKGDKERYDLH